MSSLFPACSIEIARLAYIEPVVIKRESLNRGHLRERMSVTHKVSRQRENVLNFAKHGIAEVLKLSAEDLQLVVVEEFDVQTTGSTATMTSELVLESLAGGLTERTVSQLRIAAHSLMQQLCPNGGTAAAGIKAVETVPGSADYIKCKLERDLRPEIDAVDEHLSLLAGRKVGHPMRIHVPGLAPVELSGEFIGAQASATPAETAVLRGVITGAAMVAGKKQVLRLSMVCADPKSPTSKPEKFFVEYPESKHEIVWAQLLRRLGREVCLRVEVSRKRDSTGKWTATHSLVEVVDADLRLAA